jgi:bis(5'-adenosyl)-triphosphatase
MSALLFSAFDVTTQVFYRASLSAAIVNLKPIVPGREDFKIESCIMRRTDDSINQMFSSFLLEPFHVSLILMVLFNVRCYEIL